MICPRDNEMFYGRAFRLLGLGEEALLETHLGGCGKCRERAAALERRLKVFDLVTDPVPAPDLADRILARVRATARVRKGLYLTCLTGISLVGVTLLYFLMLLAHSKAEHRFMRDLEHQLQVYRNTHGAYPPDDRPLSAYVTVPADRVDAGGSVIDRWGRPLRYVAPGARNRDLFDLQSLGRNGRDDSGFGDDICNW